MINFEQMAKSHERLFPKADLNSQVVKLEEEIGEYKQAANAGNWEQAKKELADVGVVCIGIYRFAPKVADWIFSHCVRLYGSISNRSGLPKLDDLINRKWKINEGRKWEWNGTTYHHIGKDGEE